MYYMSSSAKVGNRGENKTFGSNRIAQDVGELRRVISGRLNYKISKPETRDDNKSTLNEKVYQKNTNAYHTNKILKNIEINTYYLGTEI